MTVEITRSHFSTSKGVYLLSKNHSLVDGGTLLVSSPGEIWMTAFCSATPASAREAQGYAYRYLPLCWFARVRDVQTLLATGRFGQFDRLFLAVDFICQPSYGHQIMFPINVIPSQLHQLATSYTEQECNSNDHLNQKGFGEQCRPEAVNLRVIIIARVMTVHAWKAHLSPRVLIE